MSSATGTPSAEILPRRRSRLVEFFVRMANEKPLGTVSGIVILLLVMVGALADVLAPYPYYEMHLIDRLQGPSASYLLGNDEMGRDLLSRLMYGRASFVGRWPGGNHPRRFGRSADRRHFRIPGRQIRPDHAEIRRCLDSFPRAAHIADRNVHNGTGRAPDDTGAGHFGRHRRLKTDQGRRHRH